MSGIIGPTGAPVRQSETTGVSETGTLDGQTLKSVEGGESHVDSSGGHEQVDSVPLGKALDHLSTVTLTPTEGSPTVSTGVGTQSQELDEIPPPPPELDEIPPPPPEEEPSPKTVSMRMPSSMYIMLPASPMAASPGSSSSSTNCISAPRMS